MEQEQSRQCLKGLQQGTETPPVANPTMVVGGSFDLDGAHGVGAG